MQQHKLFSQTTHAHSSSNGGSNKSSNIIISLSLSFFLLLSIYQSICPSIYLSTHILSLSHLFPSNSGSGSPYLSLSLSLYLSISIYLSILLSIYLSIYLLSLSPLPCPLALALPLSQSLYDRVSLISNSTRLLGCFQEKNTKYGIQYGTGCSSLRKHYGTINRNGPILQFRIVWTKH